MKVQDVLNEELEDVERQFENPVAHDPSKMGDAFEFMDDADGALAQAYKQEHGIERFPTGEEYGKALQEQRRKVGEVVDVPLDRILASETHLHKDHIDKIIKGGDVKSSSEFPILYKMGNIYFVGDGNHRVAAEMIRGGRSVKAIVLDGDKILKQIENKE